MLNKSAPNDLCLQMTMKNIITNIIKPNWSIIQVHSQETHINHGFSGLVLILTVFLQTRGLLSLKYYMIVNYAAQKEIIIEEEEENCLTT